MGGPIRTVINPGFLVKAWRGQHSPALTEQIVSESNEIQPDSNGLFDSIPNDGFEYQSMTLNGKIKYIRKKKSEDSNNELQFEELEK